MWLLRLRLTIKTIVQKWDIKAQKHYPNLSYNYVAPCICSDGSEAVLKIGLPEKGISELFDEATYWIGEVNFKWNWKLLKLCSNILYWMSGRVRIELHLNQSTSLFFTQYFRRRNFHQNGEKIDRSCFSRIHSNPVDRNRFSSIRKNYV